MSMGIYKRIALWKIKKANLKIQINLIEVVHDQRIEVEIAEGEDLQINQKEEKDPILEVKVDQEENQDLKVEKELKVNIKESILEVTRKVILKNEMK